MPFVAQVAVGRRERLSVFGSDWPTPDGTGVRDYIHVVDLARGHLAALRRVESDAGMFTVNLGTGSGYSVLEMVRAFERASGRAGPVRVRAAPAGRHRRVLRRSPACRAIARLARPARRRCDVRRRVALAERKSRRLSRRPGLARLRARRLRPRLRAHARGRRRTDQSARLKNTRRPRMSPSWRISRSKSSSRSTGFRCSVFTINRGAAS